MTDTNPENIKLSVIKTLRKIVDPEIPVNVYDLGLIYDIQVDEDCAVTISMTLTSPTCPVADMIMKQVEMKVAELQEVSSAKVELVWEPAWSPQRMSEAARLELNLEPDQNPVPQGGQKFYNLNRPK